MTRIFIGGMCSLPMGTMERQLGNMAILIPMLKLLQEELPDVEIETSLQLSDKFCQAAGVTSLHIRSLYEPTLRSGLVSVLDWLRSGLWIFLKEKLGINWKGLIAGAKFHHLMQADLVLDFSGDTFGDMAHIFHLVKHSFDLFTFRNLRLPVYIFAQSPGPFTGALRMKIARLVLNRVSLVTCREKVAFENVKRMTTKTAVIQTACPAWLLQPVGAAQADAILKAEGFSRFERPLVGLNFCGFNLATELISKDKYKDRRQEDELEPLVRVVHYLLDDLKVNVVLIPHVYRTNAQGEMIPGPDGKIMDQLYTTVQSDLNSYDGRLMMLRGTYPAPQVKAVIGRCDLFIAGRLHAGVAAMSQYVPTILLAYGPKHYGFAELAGMQEYVSNNYRGAIEAQDIIDKINLLWPRRIETSIDMQSKMVHVRASVLRNIRLVKKLLEMPIENRLNPRLEDFQLD